MAVPSVSPPPPSPYALRRIFRACPDCGLPQQYIPGSGWTHLSAQALEACIAAYDEPRTDEEIRQLFSGTYQPTPTAKQKGAPPMQSNVLAVMPIETMLARMEGAKFPQQMTGAEKIMLAQAAITYALDPVMGELMLYQGHLYVSIDGRYRKAQETGDLDGVSTRPATKGERQEWDIPDGDFFFRSEVYVKGCSHPFVGWGRVRQEETRAPGRPGAAGYRPLETNPQRMAEKRAEAQALRKGFHIPLPSAESAGTLEDDTPYIDTEARELPEEEPQSHVHGEMREVRCELHGKPLRNGKYGPYCPTRVTGPDGKERWCKGQAAHPEPVEPREEGGSPELPLESPTSAITTPLTGIRVDSLGDLFNACKEHFGIKAWPEIFRILNVSDKMDIADVQQAWQIVCAFKAEPTALPEDDPFYPKETE